MFLHYAHIGHHHAPVNSLAHVIYSKQPHLNCGQRFHFHSRLPHSLHLCTAMDAVCTLVGLELHCHARQRERMA